MTVRQLQIDFNWFTNTFRPGYRKQVAQDVLNIVRATPGINHQFFGNMGGYSRRNVLPWGHVFNDLFAPNVAVLDYAHRFLRPVRDTILDYCCGIGVPAVYMSRLGFRVSGYDNWSQLPREAAERFLTRHQPHRVTLSDQLPTIGSRVLVNVSMWLENPEAVGPGVKLILADSWYRRKEKYAGNLPGWKLVAEYPNLLDVFERT